MMWFSKSGRKAAGDLGRVRVVCILVGISADMPVADLLPAIYGWHEYATAGGLMSYGPSLFDANRLVGVYVGKILNGAKPAEMPVEQTTRVDFAINMKTANKLGLVFPIPLLGLADEVIE